MTSHLSQYLDAVRVLEGLFHAQRLQRVSQPLDSHHRSDAQNRILELLAGVELALPACLVGVKRTNTD